MIKINCSYYNDKLVLLNNISNTIVSEKFYLVCQTNHLSLYTIQAENSGFDYKTAGIFFYLGAPQVFICGANWSNGCSIIVIISAFIFAFFIGLFMLLEKTLRITKTSLNNVKLEILKENRLIFDELDLLEEITKANKMNEQENMAKHLKVQLDDDKYDKDLKQNLYLYGTKNIDYNELAYKGGEKGDDFENGYAGKGVFSNPPKKKSKPGFIIDDIDDKDITYDDNNSEEKETKINKSVKIINNKKTRHKNREKITKEKVNKKNENKKPEEKNNTRFYRVKEYNPDKSEPVNNYNYNLYKDSDFGLMGSERSEDNNLKSNGKDKNSDLKEFDNSSIKDSTDELKIKEKTIKKKKKNEKSKNNEKTENEEDIKEENKKDENKINELIIYNIMMKIVIKMII